jgi:hypothetical protein
MKPLIIAALGLSLSGYAASAGQSPLVNFQSVFTLIKGGHGGGGHGGAGSTGGPGYVTLDDNNYGPSEYRYRRPAHPRRYRAYRRHRRAAD